MSFTSPNLLLLVLLFTATQLVGITSKQFIDLNDYSKSYESDGPKLKGNTALHLAALRKDTNLVELLLNNGADVNAKNCRQETPLHYAARSGSLEIVKRLLDTPEIDKNTSTIYTSHEGQFTGSTPLHLAVLREDTKIVKLLLERGADVNVVNYYQGTPLEYAVSRENLKIVKLLCSRQDIDPNIKDFYGMTPLHRAAMKMPKPEVPELNEIIKVLVRAPKIDVNMQQTTDVKEKEVYVKKNAGWTALHWAAYWDNKDAATILLENGANNNLKDQEDKTAAQIASNKGHSDLADFIKEYKSAR